MSIPHCVHARFAIIHSDEFEQGMVMHTELAWAEAGATKPVIKGTASSELKPICLTTWRRDMPSNFAGTAIS